ncbi:DNA topoisomerase IB [Palleronia sp. LCG004]|uniref:DNA topoisomerase IB n=1 Tax=Palleronia sp. LCG004 TaxID=3079304 RepID=UPI0029434564|nr:DNA topoisomerase IB [Palleronia sp. LCG004]WOI55399.1 DNA topoisomerase IB [Palleronia sp. LCG004]
MQDIPDLVYFPDTRPGITRKKAGRGWSYRAPDGTRIEQKRERQRLDALAVPPAYRDVWICPRSDGHLQATGRDDRKRKQYRYHEAWTAFRSQKKYGDLPAFGDCLPQIRRRIARDLAGDVGDRAVATAAVLAMIDRLSMRVGNRDYAEENGTFGATTLRPRHVALTPEALKLDYKGKGGIRIRRTLRDRRLAKVLHQLDDLPGATLVTWLDEDGDAHEVTSGEVNELLHDITGVAGFTAKTFRTWNGTVAAMEVALSEEKLSIKAMAEAASERLGNTPAIARNSYIHPQVIALSEVALDDRAAFAKTVEERRGLRRSERALLKLLAG